MAGEWLLLILVFFVILWFALGLHRRRNENEMENPKVSRKKRKKK